MSGIKDRLEAVERAQTALSIRKNLLLEKAMHGSNPSDILKAAEIFNSQNKPIDQAPKAYLIDPLDFNSFLGYKDKPFSLSYETLRRMSRTPIINSIIKTRKNQIADFAEPQADRYSTGFVIRRKPKFGIEQKMDVQDKKIAASLTDFILNCGDSESWDGDEFDEFIRKIVDDSLTFDQMTFECLYTRRGKLSRFMATDAATFRIADSYFDKDYDNEYFDGAMAHDRQSWGQKINGYYPSYVQIYQAEKIASFYPWELCFGIRNPTTSVHANGYGMSELEELINVVTSMLWGDEYNRRFFSQGSAPKGLLRIKGQVNEASLQQFKQQWQAMIQGVMQSWKTPVVEGDVDWVNLQMNNRDMEYTAWMEYLIKIACAVYCIDPTEIGWDIARSGSGGGGPLFEDSQKQRLQNSKDKGLYPMLKFIQRKINKYIIDQINPDFEFVFMGLNGMTISEELEMDIKRLSAFQTVDEIREKWDLPKINDSDEGLGSTIENPVFQQAKAAKAQAAMGGMGGMGAGVNPFEEAAGMVGGAPGDEVAEQGQAAADQGTAEEPIEPENPFDLYAQGDDEETEKAMDVNPLVKAFDEYLSKTIQHHAEQED